MNKELVAMTAALAGQGLSAHDAVQKAIKLLEEAELQSNAYNKERETE